MIASLNLEESRATLLLEDFPDSDSDDGSDSNPQPADSSRSDAARPGTSQHGNESESSAKNEGGGGGKGPRKKGPSLRKVVVDLTANAFTNAEAYYEERKAALEKIKRTEQVRVRLRNLFSYMTFPQLPCLDEQL
jgi:predicted ribosome quality control (RQC) complex YloA/Tae2 family protein